MNRQTIYFFIIITIFLLSACSDLPKSNYQELGWEDLTPIEEEKEVDQRGSWGALEVSDDWSSERYAQNQGRRGIYAGALPQAYSIGVVSDVEGKKIRVPGFIVPIEFDAVNLVTEFFLVPYFGACFHMPPPPPNQTIYVTSVQPIEYESIYDPVLIMGVIKTEQTDNEIATAAYSMKLDYIEPYDEITF